MLHPTQPLGKSCHSCFNSAVLGESLSAVTLIPYSCSTMTRFAEEIFLRRFLRLCVSLLLVIKIMVKDLWELIYISLRNRLCDIRVTLKHVYT
jgi:hypothetical protein